jgi:hypothetical protein
VLDEVAAEEQGSGVVGRERVNNEEKTGEGEDRRQVAISHVQSG